MISRGGFDEYADYVQKSLKQPNIALSSTMTWHSLHHAVHLIAFRIHTVPPYQQPENQPRNLCWYFQVNKQMTAWFTAFCKTETQYMDCDTVARPAQCS